MDFTRKIYVKFEALSTHVKKFETHVVQKGEAVKKQEALIKGKGEDAQKHHMRR